MLNVKREFAQYCSNSVQCKLEKLEELVVPQNYNMLRRILYNHHCARRLSQNQVDEVQDMSNYLWYFQAMTPNFTPSSLRFQAMTVNLPPPSGLLYSVISQTKQCHIPGLFSNDFVGCWYCASVLRTLFKDMFPLYLVIRINPFLPILN